MLRRRWGVNEHEGSKPSISFFLTFEASSIDGSEKSVKAKAVLWVFTKVIANHSQCAFKKTLQNA
jgi:hypothetical protein